MKLIAFGLNRSHIKKLTISKLAKNGRNNYGHIVVRGLGGGVKRRILLIDFFKRIFDVPAIIRRVEKDMNRTGFVFLVCYENGFLSYVLAPDKLNIGAFMVTKSISTKNTFVGVHLPLKFIPVGFLVHNVGLAQAKWGQLARSAGTFCQILKHIIEFNKFYVLVRLPSGEQRLILSDAYATIGIVSNGLHKNLALKKAGENRWLGKRPIVRGVAKNPVDHPHGGNTSGGRCSVTPWGILTKGYKTRKSKKFNKFIV